MRHRAAAPHAVDLADGRMLAPGETADIDPDHPHHRAAIQDGRLISAAPPAAPPDPPVPQPPPPVPKSRRSSPASSASDPPNALGLPADAPEEE